MIIRLYLFWYLRVTHEESRGPKPDSHPASPSNKFVKLNNINSQFILNNKHDNKICNICGRFNDIKILIIKNLDTSKKMQIAYFKNWLF